MISYLNLLDLKASITLVTQVIALQLVQTVGQVRTNLQMCCLAVHTLSKERLTCEVTETSKHDGNSHVFG